MDIPLWVYPLLFLTAVAAGFVDSIAGGGGLVSIPVLLNIGLPPQMALGTNKLQAVFGSGSATWHYGRAGLMDWKECKTGILATFIGAATGSGCVNILKPDLLERWIPWLLVVVALFLLCQPDFGKKDRRPHLNRIAFHVLFGLLIGFYDGFFGPGTGTLWAMAYMLVLGLDMTRATAHTKVMNFTSNLTALVVFLFAGQVHYGAGLSMGAGQLVGARLGSRIVIHKGARVIRPIFITVALAITLRLVWKNVAQS